MDCSNLQSWVFRHWEDLGAYYVHTYNMSFGRTWKKSINNTFIQDSWSFLSAPPMAPPVEGLSNPCHAMAWPWVDSTAWAWAQRGWRKTLELECHWPAQMSMYFQCFMQFWCVLFSTFLDIDQGCSNLRKPRIMSCKTLRQCPFASK